MHFTNRKNRDGEAGRRGGGGYGRRILEGSPIKDDRLQNTRISDNKMQF
ncbi:hypothetical protein A2U01_0044518, partial [Trifolium medium]|nr:hypothetical protein [Trifolium medium]